MEWSILESKYVWNFFFLNAFSHIFRNLVENHKSLCEANAINETRNQTLCNCQLYNILAENAQLHKFQRTKQLVFVNWSFKQLQIQSHQTWQRNHWTWNIIERLKVDFWRDKQTNKKNGSYKNKNTNV